MSYAVGDALPPFVVESANPEAMKASIQRMLGYAPQAMYLTHYGRVEQVEKLAAGMKDGSFAVFTGPVLDNTGKERLAKGTVADQEWRDKIDFYGRGGDGGVDDRGVVAHGWAFRFVFLKLSHGPRPYAWRWPAMQAGSPGIAGGFPHLRWIA